PLRPAVHAPAHLAGGAEGVFGDRAARRARDLLRPVGDLARGALVALAPLLRAVGVVDRHADDGDRVVDAGDRGHARDPPARADDDLAVDLLAQDAVGGADAGAALLRHARALT